MEMLFKEEGSSVPWGVGCTTHTVCACVTCHCSDYIILWEMPHEFDYQSKPHKKKKREKVKKYIKKKKIPKKEIKQKYQKKERITRV